MDKNPKHPLKKKKAVSKINIADHEALRKQEKHTVQKNIIKDKRKDLRFCRRSFLM